MAEAAWWTARLEECISARDRAFAAYMDAGNVRRAAIVAMALAKDYYAKGSLSIGSAWVKRAEHLPADTRACVEQGWLHRIRGTACKELRDYRRAGDCPEAAKRWCDRQAIAGFPGMCRV
jgi:hypothetical protein